MWQFAGHLGFLKVFSRIDVMSTVKVSFVIPLLIPTDCARKGPLLLQLRKLLYFTNLQFYMSQKKPVVFGSVFS